MQQVSVVSLLIVGVAGIWFGFTEDFKLGVLVMLIAFGAATFYSFHGGFRPLAELPKYVPAEPNAGKLSRGVTNGEAQLPLIIMAGSAIAAIGFWFGFTQDAEIFLLVGIIAAGATTLTSFRGKLTF